MTLGIAFALGVAFSLGVAVGRIVRRPRPSTSLAAQQRRWIAQRSHRAAVAVCDLLSEGQTLAILACKRADDRKFNKNTDFRRGIQVVIEGEFTR